MTLSVCLTALRRRRKIVLATLVVIGGGAAFFWSTGAALALGLLAGALLAILLEKSDPSVKSILDVRDRLGLVPLCLVPPILPAGRGDQAGLRPLIGANTGPVGARDAFRVLAAGLPEPDGRGAQVVMLTSSVPGEGKSTVSGNLAAFLGRKGYRVLLIGCDLRRPSLGGMFGQADAPGLTDLLEHDEAAACRTLDNPPIDFIPGGHIPDNPAELLDSAAMRELLERLRQRYDYLILDAPPVLPVTDAQLLVPLSDVLLTVLEPGRIRLDAARQMIEDLEAVGGRIDGMVLNDRLGLAGRYYGGFPAVEAARPVPRPGESTLRRGPVSATGLLGGLAVVLACVIGGLAWMVSEQGEKDDPPKQVQTSLPARVSRPDVPAATAPANHPGTSGDPIAATQQVRPPTVESDPAPLGGEEPASPVVPGPEPFAEKTASMEAKPGTPGPAVKPAEAEMLKSAAIDEAIETEAAGEPAAAGPGSEPLAPAAEETPAAARPAAVASKSSVASRPQEAVVATPVESVQAGSPTSDAKTQTPVMAGTAPKPEPVRAAPAGAAANPGLAPVSGDKDPEPFITALAQSWDRATGRHAAPGKALVQQLAGLGLEAAPLEGSLGTFLGLDTPLLLELRTGEGGAAWHAVTGRRGYRWQIRPAAAQGGLLNLVELQQAWTGSGYLPYVDPRQLAGFDPRRANREAIAELQALLAATGRLEQFERGVYDRSTIKALGRLQAENGLPVTGGLTPATLILLYQADAEVDVPEFTLWGQNVAHAAP